MSEEALQRFSPFQPSGLHMMPIRSGQRHLDLDTAFGELAEAESEQKHILSTWQDIVRYVMPGRRQFFRDGATMEPEDFERADSDPIQAAREGAGTIVQAMLPAERDWYDLVAGPDLEEELGDDVQAWNEGLERWRDRQFAELLMAGFPQAAHEMALDLLMGTGAMLVLPGDFMRPLRIETVPIAGVFPVAGPTGEVETVYRKPRVRPMNIKRNWPRAKLTDKLAKAARERATERVDLVEGVVYMPETYDYVRFVAEAESREILDAETLRTSPWIVARFMRRSGEALGWGPLMEVVDDVRVLNDMTRTELRANKINAEPPLSVDMTRAGAMVGQSIAYRPRAINYTTGPSAIEPMNVGVRPEFAQISAEQRRSSVRRACLADDPFPQAETAGQRTAEEYRLRAQMKLLRAGAEIGRLHNEWFKRVLVRSADVLSSFGPAVFPAIPVGNRKIAIKYRGPLMQAHMQGQALETVEALELARRAAGPEEVALQTDSGEIVRDVMQQMGASPTHLADEREVAAKRQAMAQMATQG
jgi:hypothetical protein